MGVPASGFLRVVALGMMASAWSAAACMPDDPEPACVYRDGYCTCRDMFEPTDTVRECSAATMGGPVVCCDDGEHCQCGLYSCNFATASCFCTDVGDPHPPATSCTGMVCCADDVGLCTCDNTTLPCSRGSAQVASCTAETHLCGPGERRVEKCLQR